MIDKEVIKMVQNILYIVALMSTIGSIIVYNMHSETLGMFIGLWVPTLLLLSNRVCPWAGCKRVDCNKPL
jgi:hypothetical protein